MTTVGKTVAIARLIHLNGAPATGKTSLAERFLTDHPLALLVDIDGLRTRLGQWDRRDDSRTVARDLALALTEAHLRAAHDVIVPQYVGRVEFVERLAALAQTSGAEFVEIMLVAEPTTSIERFRSRRHEFRVAGVRHPEADVDDAAIEGAVADAIERLAALREFRPGVRTVPSDVDPVATYRALLAALASPPS